MGLNHSTDELVQELNNAEDAFREAVVMLSSAAEANDEDPGHHLTRMNEYSGLLAKSLGMPDDFVRDLHFYAQIHDVGKIHIHPDILKKKGPLGKDEWGVMKKHTIFGAKILGNGTRLKMAKNIALTHHEKYDGTGYPHGMTGEEIPLEGRILALADVYDTLRSRRSYKETLSHESSFEIITKGNERSLPSHYDPNILNAFKKIHTQMDEIYTDLAD
jgi:response regulator RpfG family c-di-GMP phosphodiesterase